MDRFGELKTFISVVEAGGFSAAARQTGVSQPSLSKALAALEKRLGVVLIRRSTRHVGVTEAGRLYYERAKPLLEELQEVDEETSHRRGGASGLLRMSLPATFGRLHGLPLIPALLAAHPGLEVEIILADTLRDMIEDRIDLAVRVGAVTEPDVVVHKVARTPLVCVGSRRYFEAHGRPEIPSDLLAHDCLIYGSRRGADEWPFSGPGKAHRLKIAGRLRSNSTEAIRAGVLAGVGIGMMTRASLAGELDVPDVECILQPYIATSLPVSIVWPTRRFVPEKVRLATALLKSALALRLG
jgi:DNA-binding transcriptional LysR family regulator